MNKQIAEALLAKSEEVANKFSITDRGGNYLNETFTVHRIVVLSECTAAVIYNKSPTAKRAVAWFYYVNRRTSPYWAYFFITYNHLAGLDAVKDLLHEVEQFNFSALIKEQ